MSEANVSAFIDFMKTIRELFDPARDINRRIETVITYDAADEARLQTEISEYVVTENIEASLDKLVGEMQDAMEGGGNHEIGVWVSGFYGSGKSSFTKYLGFALDDSVKLGDKTFLDSLKGQITSAPLKARLNTLANRFPAAVVMLDLASEMLAGATMKEISTVLYYKVLQWAGYSEEKKIAYLEYMLEKDGHYEAFKARASELLKGKSWKSVHNQPLVTKAIASRLAVEFYPEIFPDTKSFNDLKLEEAEFENKRVTEMLELIKRVSGKEHAIIILDEVGEYLKSKKSLVLNLQGLAQNIKKIGGGKVWILATAQQTLTEDDPNSQFNSSELFKLKDRFPIPVDLEASDIKEICYRRLLAKRAEGEDALGKVFDQHGQTLRHATKLKDAPLYDSDLDKKTFTDLYPFLPHHFEILLQLLGRLAKSSGGVGLRSAIKVIQDILIDADSEHPMADQDLGVLANTVTFYDTLKRDIRKSFKFVIDGVDKVEQIFSKDSLETKVAKSIAVLQILENLPVTEHNLAALIHPSVDAAQALTEVAKAVEALNQEASIPLGEKEGSYRFMSEAVTELDRERQKMIVREADRRSLFNAQLRDIFSPVPTARLNQVRTVTSGIKVLSGGFQSSLAGEKEPIQLVIEFLDPSQYEKGRQERIDSSCQPSNKNLFYLIARQDNHFDDLVAEIKRCEDIAKRHRNATDSEIREYVKSQDTRAQRLTNEQLIPLIRKQLMAGSFIFQGQPKPASELGETTTTAANKELAFVADIVFEKYSEASLQPEGALAEKFLKSDLAKISTANDPLGLVQKTGGKTKIQTGHLALRSICGYLEKMGTVEGRRFLDHFYDPPFGWSKDTTRYLVAALLTSGEIKLRVGGGDITVRGEEASAALKNNQSFNKVGIATREEKPQPEFMTRASQRLLELTGETVLPIEEEISKAAVRYLPDYQQRYASLGAQLSGLNLTGEDRIDDIQTSITEIIRSDGADAVQRLGGEDSPLFGNLKWAESVKKAFEHGLDQLVRDLRSFESALSKLPSTGIPKQLQEQTEEPLEGANEYLGRDAFFDFQSDIQKQIETIEKAVAAATSDLQSQQHSLCDSELARIQDCSFWQEVDAAARETAISEIEALKINVEPDLNGLQSLLAHSFDLNAGLRDIEDELKRLARRREEEREEEEPNEEAQEDKEPSTETSLILPKAFKSVDEVDSLIKELERLKAHFARFQEVKIKWED